MTLTTPEPGETRIWAHLAQAQHGLGVLSLYHRLVEGFGPLSLALSGHPAVLGALPPLPEGVTPLPPPEDRRREVRVFLDQLNARLCLWSGGAFHPVLLGEWQRRGGHGFLIEAQAELLFRPKRMGIPGPLRRLLAGFDHAWPVDAAALDRLTALAMTEDRLTANGGLQIAPPMQSVDAASLENLSHSLSGRHVWCAVEPSLRELAWLCDIQEKSRAINHRLLMATLPRPGLELETASLLSERLRAPLARIDQPPEDRIGAVLVGEASHAALWLRIALFALLGGSTSADPMADPLRVAACGAPVAAGPEHAPYRLGWSALRTAGAAQDIHAFTDFSRPLLEAVQPKTAADFAARAWERLTRGARASDDLAERVLDILEGAVP